MKLSGYLTVYMTLIMTVMLSLCLALIEGVRWNAICLETECVMDVGMNSIFAEYHKELYKQYNLFAIDSSYGQENCGKICVEEHLKSYIHRNLSTEGLILGDYLYKDFLGLSEQEVSVERVSILTDQDGAVFRKCAAEVMKDDVGLTFLSKVPGWVETVSAEHLLEYDAAAQKQLINEELQKYQGKEKEVRPGVFKKMQVTDPTINMETARLKGALNCVVQDPQKLSEKSIIQDILIGNRQACGSVNGGTIIDDSENGLDPYMEDLLFRAYLFTYMGHYLKEKEGKALDYQLEYLLIGKDSDVANLYDVAERLVGMRWIANLGYIYTDSVKCSQAEALAFSLSLLIGSPEAKEAFKSSILFSWAFGESLHDLELLFADKRVPLLKTREDWYYSLEGMLTGYFPGDTSEHTNGLSYEEYLFLLLMFVDQKTLTRRAMTMVEADIRLTPGNQNFRMDACLSQVQANLRMESSYGYLYEITRRKRYR